MKKIRDRLKKIIKNKDSRGFTLLELIISVAVLSVIMVMIFSIMTSGSVFFEKSNSMMKVSYSLQETMSQVKETVIDCSSAIKIVEGADNTEFVVVNKTGSNSYLACAYKYDADAKILYYGETAFSSPKDTTLPGKIKSDKVLTEGVTAFSAKPEISTNPDSETGLKRIKSLSVSVTVEKNGRSDSAVERIAPRNNPLMVTSYDQIPVE